MDRRAVIGAVALAGALALACHSATQTSTSSPAPKVRLTVARGESFSPSSGDSAIAAFVPEVQPVDSGGECRLFRTRGSGATMATAYFPSFDSARTSVTLAFDSAGHLVRFGDRRGGVRFRTPEAITEAQRDSAMSVARAAVRSTTISFDYAVDQAVAANEGGGKPTQAVIGPVRSMENLQKLGPPTKRLVRVRQLCGV
jgi:hypothetical protein